MATGSATGEQGSAHQEQPVADHADAVTQIFAQFEFAYHNQFHKAFPEKQDLIIAKKFWLDSLREFSPAQIVAAARQVVREQTFLPSLSTMVQACLKGREVHGLPDNRRAYTEACNAASPKAEQTWSHPAVYLAGKAAGWHLLASEPESVAMPIFEYHYEQLCRKVVAGEQLGIDAPPALPEKIETPLSAEELHTRLEKLRKDLGL